MSSDHHVSSGWPYGLGIVLALLVGGTLVVDSALRSSATYDEVAYLQVASEWWRTGKQDRIARMGSPLTFWKLQQAPVLLALERGGFHDLIKRPIERQADLLPLVRLGSIWIWALALLLTAGWTTQQFGQRSGVIAAWWFALSPNLIAHGSLATMEMPLVACAAGILWGFSRFLETGRWLWLWFSAAACGVAFSCKFTAILLPPLLGAAWLWEALRSRTSWRLALVGTTLGMAAFLVVMAVANLLLAAGAMLPLSERQGQHPAVEKVLGPKLAALAELPLPQDAVAFARQMQHQRTGGPSYLAGERRMRGWWYYYLVCLALKVPLGVGLLLAIRLAMSRTRKSTAGERLAFVLIAGVLMITALGSTRNYGFRYLLFLAPAAIMVLAGLVKAGSWPQLLLLAGLLGQVVATASSHPHELTYFNALAGGAEGGKFWLSDSNLDWGQGAKALARLQDAELALNDLTLFYFGDTDPAHYGVSTKITHLIDAHGPKVPLEPSLSASTPYLAVSRSLQFGPWGPPGYFKELTGPPHRVTDDHTIAIYRWPQARSNRPVKPDSEK